MKATLPPIAREEWLKIVRGDIKHRFTNYVLQLHVDKSKSDVSRGKISPETASKDLYTLCSKYVLAVQKDMEAIFKSW